MIEIEDIRTRWNAVELEILIPAVLSDAQLGAIEAFRLKIDDPECVASFRESSPFTVARFIAEEEREILAWARKQMGVTKDGDFIEQKRALFARDIAKIHNSLFGIVIAEKADCEIGRFTRTRLGKLHPDRPTRKELFVVYHSRIGAIPAEVIDGIRMMNATQDEKILIDRARLNTAGFLGPGEALHEHKILRDTGILREIPLGEVAMYLTGSEGTLHCSSTIPKDVDAYSGFFRLFGALPYPTQRVDLMNCQLYKYDNCLHACEA